MSKPGPIAAWSQYIAARTAAAGMMSFDVACNLDVAGSVGRLLHSIDKRHRQRCQASIKRAFPHYTQNQIDDIAEKSFEHFTRLVVEVFHTPREISIDSWSNHCQMENLAPALKILNAGQPAIMLTGHVGNWEALGYMLATLGYPVDAIARPIDNPLINDWLLGIRQKQGMRIITKFDASQRMIEVLDRGGTLAFIADQNAGDKGLFVPFFGSLASSYKSIGLLAMNQKVPIICGYAHRIGLNFKFEMGVTDVIYPDQWQDQEDPLFYITARYNRAIEMMIQKRPDQYLWMHRRWKSRPRFERLGKPMPKSLRRKLESLPWMDQQQIDAINQTNLDLK